MTDEEIPIVVKEAFSKPVLLVVEDDALVRTPVADYLRDAGFGVLEAANAHEALGIMAARGPVALVFSDIRMPGPMDGGYLAKWVALNRPYIPVILTSAAANMWMADNTPIKRFIAKPFSLPILEKQIREVLDAPFATA